MLSATRAALHVAVNIEHLAKARVHAGHEHELHVRRDRELCVAWEPRERVELSCVVIRRATVGRYAMAPLWKVGPVLHERL